VLVGVLGDQGLFGSDLNRILDHNDLPTIGYNRTNFGIKMSDSELIEKFKDLDFIVNCIAYTNVNLAESNFSEACYVNGTFPAQLARVSNVLGTKLIHISTDYVFGGNSKFPYKTSDPTNPISAYGKSKNLGERAIIDSANNYTIMRTAWLYGANGKSFPKYIQNSLLTKGIVEVVNDQFGQPTWTKDLADQVVQVLNLKKLPSIVHATSNGYTTWYDFACEIAISLNMNHVDCVKPIESSAFPSIVERPKWSVLNNSNDVGISPIANWKERWKKAAPEVLTSSY